MAKDILYNIATAQGPQVEIGKVAILRVGKKRLRCVITGPALTDWRSGYRIGTILEAKVRAMVARGSHFRLSDHQAAQETMDFLVARAGADRVLAEFAKYPTINTKEEALEAPKVAA